LNPKFDDLKIGFGESIFGYGVGERDDFKGHLLLGRARNLLSFERDEKSLPVLFGNDIDKSRKREFGRSVVSKSGRKQIAAAASAEPPLGVAAAALRKVTIRTRRKAPPRQFFVQKPPNPAFWAVCCVKSLRAIVSPSQKPLTSPYFTQ
jgi:hypothetical protein